MFLLDTNVLSAMMAPVVPSKIEQWVTGTPLRFLFTATICEAEILAGIAVLPEGRRRRDLTAAARYVLAHSFAQKIWPFDSDAAQAYAEIVAVSWSRGRRAEAQDLMIAAIAQSRDAAVVTRNVRDFDGCGVAVINPWEE